MTGSQEHAAILRAVASRAVREARTAWKKAHDTPDEKHTREAFRSCVLAARVLRKTAEVMPREARQMRAEAKRLDAAADELKTRLVHIVEA